MKQYQVEVPAYFILTLAARTPEIAAEAAEDYVKEAYVNNGATIPMNWPINGITIETQKIELLHPEEDRTPDVYEIAGNRLVLANDNELSTGTAMG